MLVLLLLGETTIATFLFGVLVIALIVTTRHADLSATYKLRAVRDDLINACVFAGVPTNNPWLEALYENVNSILLHSCLPGGQQRWPPAIAFGQFQASNPFGAKQLVPLPRNGEKCPTAIRALEPALRSALEDLSTHHLGLFLHVDAHSREQRRLQREKAKHLLEMINRQGGHVFLAEQEHISI